MDIQNKVAVITGGASGLGRATADGSVHVCCNFAGTGNAIKTFGRKGVFPLAEFDKIIQIH